MRRLLLPLCLLGLLAVPSTAGADILGVGDERLFLISDDGATRTPLAKGSPSDVTWSPDGQRIAFSVNREGVTHLVAGPPEGPFADVGGSTGLTQPAWSPDGTTFAARRGKAIVLLPAAGGAPTAVTSGGDDGEPAWSPDGAQIAFVRTPPETADTTPDNPGPVMVVRADGTGLRQLTPAGGSPAWSPDGTRVAFTTGRDANGETCENEGTEEAFCIANREVYVIGADGTGERRLTNNPADDRFPSWSPDGSRIAFASDRHWRDAELWVMDADGTCATQITLSSTSVYRPVWRPNLPVGRGPCGVRRTAYYYGFDVQDAVRPAFTDPLYLGATYLGMIPSAASRGYLDYNECADPRAPRSCGGRVTIATSSTCRRNPARSAVRASRVETIRGALVLHFFFRVHVISGGTTTEIYADEGKRPFLRRAVAALRPMRRPLQRGRLAAPQLPPRAWARLRDARIRRALTRLGAGRRPACAR